MMTTVRDEREKGRVPTRVPLEQQNVLKAMERPGFKRMFVLEKLGEVKRHELAGWVLVSDPEFKTNDGQVQFASQLDSVVRMVCNQDPTAPVKTQVLMEIPIEYYEEDHRAHQAKITAEEDQWTKLKPGEYGEVSISQK